jgi:hypothetical protein
MSGSGFGASPPSIGYWAMVLIGLYGTVDEQQGSDIALDPETLRASRRSRRLDVLPDRRTWAEGEPVLHPEWYAGPLG